MWGRTAGISPAQCPGIPSFVSFCRKSGSESIVFRSYLRSFLLFYQRHGSASVCLALRRWTLSRVEIFVPWISLFKHLMILLLILVTHRLSDDASSSAMFTGIIFRIHLPSRPAESTSFYDPWAIIDVTRDLSVLHEGRIDKFSILGRKPQSTEGSMKRRLSPRR